MRLNYRVYQWAGVVLSLVVSSSHLYANKLTDRIFVDDLFPEEHLNILKSDIQRFRAFPMQYSANPLLKRITHLNTLDSASLLSWLESWVHFLVHASTFDQSKRLQIRAVEAASVSVITDTKSLKYSYSTLFSSENLDPSKSSASAMANIPNYPQVYVSGTKVWFDFLRQLNQFSTSSSLFPSGLDLSKDQKRVSELENSYPREVSPGSDQFLMVNLGMSKYQIYEKYRRHSIQSLFVHDGLVFNVNLISPAVGFVMVYDDLFDSVHYETAGGFSRVGMDGGGSVESESAIATASGVGIGAPAPEAAPTPTPVSDPVSPVGGPSVLTNEIDPLALSLFRLATLFHEAAHSRGHGAHAGFPHEVCPDGMGDHSGQLHCDPSVNGGNGIKAAFLAAALDSCKAIRKDGRQSEFPMCFHKPSLDFLKFHGKDALSRVLSTSRYLDDGGALFDIPAEADATEESKSMSPNM